MLRELIGRFQFPVPESFVQQQIEARLDLRTARWHSRVCRLRICANWTWPPA
jgi:hypothetical protein